MLEVSNVNKGFFKNDVLKDVSLTVKKGEIHGLVGENSAGKTTLIKCLTGIYKADSGVILYDDLPIFDNPKAKEKIGYVADTNDFIPCYTIKKLVKMYAAFYDKFSVEDFDSLNEVFKLNKNKMILNLSKGQKMRLAFMLSVAINPDYLILDEPTSGLDVMSKKELFDILIRLVENKNIGVLISSHNLENLEKICDSITILREGRVCIQNNLDQVKGTLSKCQVVFKDGFPANLKSEFEILDYSNVGSIYTLVFKGEFSAFEKLATKHGASAVEEIPISLEELFIKMNTSEEK